MGLTGPALAYVARGLLPPLAIFYGTASLRDLATWHVHVWGAAHFARGIAWVEWCNGGRRARLILRHAQSQALDGGTAPNTRRAQMDGATERASMPEPGEANSCGGAAA